MLDSIVEIVLTAAAYIRQCFEVMLCLSSDGRNKSSKKN
jgi:hypothetical protein